jgi:hypothetical protein
VIAGPAGREKRKKLDEKEQGYTITDETKMYIYIHGKQTGAHNGELFG